MRAPVPRSSQTLHSVVRAGLEAGIPLFRASVLHCETSFTPYRSCFARGAEQSRLHLAGGARAKSQRLGDLYGHSVIASAGIQARLSGLQGG